MPHHKQTLVTLCSLAIAITLVGCRTESPHSIKEQTVQPAEYVGRTSCVSCHKIEASLWEGSQHDLAMQTATNETVLGDFDRSTFEYAGVITTFFRENERFMVQTDGPDGQLQDFEITYTFGIDPLQQYLIEFPDGRLQALNVCWDTRPVDEGGQRWFHLYPDDAVDHTDTHHWTGPLQNWNYMCSECHSTHVKKNFSADDDRYETTWSEIDVSCEACHGPGSNHNAWASNGMDESDTGMGLVVTLADSDGGRWSFDDGADTAHRDPLRTSDVQLDTCARCHSRRTQLTDDYRHGRPFGDSHRLAALDEGLYHADGQILDEVYVYGSFLQSKMHASGVTCGDCHDPHTAKLRLEGDATCGVCHRQDKFDSPDHHFHEEGSAGASCVECHMRSRNYMVVDPRRDHSFRIPRPDLSMKIGTPNACTDCHVGRDAAWADAALDRWFGSDRDTATHYGEAIHAGRTWQSDAGRQLTAVIENLDTPAIVRATALNLVRAFPSPRLAHSIEASIAHDDPLVRREAAAAMESLDASQRATMGLPILDDPVRMVRIEAARVLALLARDDLTPDQLSILDRGLEGYVAVQRFNADRSEGQLNLGWAASMKGQTAEAEQAYRTALRITPTFSPAAINLADLYRVLGRDAEGAALLETALRRASDDGHLHHALGLTRVRQKRYNEALELLERAVALSPDRPRYAYVFGVALHSMGDTSRALAVLKQAHERYPGHVDLLYALATTSRDSGDVESTRQYARRLLELAPGHPGATALLVP
ncbi:MAG: tetratricopeptide repeat protein [Acidobacteriota bacterium]|nr:tetratricopeptide repeat protein [Acidobacteriota bacterium]MDH3784405.1 tetratricopeptide repeat protein [Acidobacteriota bacterium]